MCSGRRRLCTCWGCSRSVVSHPPIFSRHASRRKRLVGSPPTGFLPQSGSRGARDGRRGGRCCVQTNICLPTLLQWWPSPHPMSNRAEIKEKKKNYNGEYEAFIMTFGRRFRPKRLRVIQTCIHILSWCEICCHNKVLSRYYIIWTRSFSRLNTKLMALILLYHEIFEDNLSVQVHKRNVYRDYNKWFLWYNNTS